MANGNSAAKKAAPVKRAAKRPAFKLPASIKSEPAQWPGSNRGAGSANAELRAQLATEVESMELGQSRKYFVDGAAENDGQKAFVSLFRKVVDSVWTEGDSESPNFGKPVYGVQASYNKDEVTVKLTKRVTRARKAAATS